jgi:hypothetical protein
VNPHSPLYQPEILEQPHAMRVDGENVAVERVKHHAPSGLQADAWKRRKIAFKSLSAQAPEPRTGQAPEVSRDLLQGRFDLSRLNTAQADIVEDPFNVVRPGVTDCLPSWESVPKLSIHLPVLHTAQSRRKNDVDQLADRMPLVAETGRAVPPRQEAVHTFQKGSRVLHQNLCEIVSGGLIGRTRGARVFDLSTPTLT